jgi:uncharacterized protein YbjT (DUF2867 family)
LRVLVTGATGLIGSAVVARLRRDGHDVIAAVRRRDSAALRLPANRLLEIDMVRALTADAWGSALSNIDAVVNCAGVLQDSPRDSTAGVHAEGAAALFGACERGGVRRIVHLSALGAGPQGPSAFSRSKFRGDAALMATKLDWVILRPSVVVGRAAYGGSALFRGLAVLPILPVVPDTAPIQIVQLDDVVDAIQFFLAETAPARLVLEVAGPERLSVTEVAQAYRRWLGLRPARLVRVPRWAANMAYRLGDAAALLGWRPAVRSTAAREILRGAVTDETEWMRMTSIRPKSLDAALAAEPASVQERWFAKLYLLKAAMIAGLAAFWLATGAISLSAGYAAGKDLLEQAGASGALASAGVIAGSLLDIAIGASIAVRRTAAQGLYAAIAVCVLYALAGTVLLPRLWADPLGPLLKILPVLILSVAALAILDER